LRTEGRLFGAGLLVLREWFDGQAYIPITPAQPADELNIAFASAECQTICKGIGKALPHFNISEIARQTGQQRISIYRAFGDEQLPNFSTVLGVLTAMGLQTKVVPRRSRRS